MWLKNSKISGSLSSSNQIDSVTCKVFKLDVCLPIFNPVCMFLLSETMDRKTPIKLNQPSNWFEEEAGHSCQGESPSSNDPG